MNCACRFVLSCCCKWLLLVRDCPWGLLAAVLGLKLAAVVLCFHWGCFLDSVSLFKPLRLLRTCTLAQAIPYVLSLAHVFLAQGRQEHNTPQSKYRRSAKQIA